MAAAIIVCFHFCLVLFFRCFQSEWVHYEYCVFVWETRGPSSHKTLMSGWLFAGALKYCMSKCPEMLSVIISQIVPPNQICLMLSFLLNASQIHLNTDKFIAKWLDQLVIFFRHLAVQPSNTHECIYKSQYKLTYEQHKLVKPRTFVHI